METSLKINELKEKNCNKIVIFFSKDKIWRALNKNKFEK